MNDYAGPVRYYPFDDSAERAVTLFVELIYALAVLSVCVVIHTTALVLCGKWLVKRRELIGMHSTRLISVLIGVCVFIILMHVIETAVWAFFFWHKDLFPDFETSLYFSMGSYTTIGYGDVVLQHNWRLLGAVEGLSGVLLSGLSTAFVFAVVNASFQMRYAER